MFKEPIIRKRIGEIFEGNEIEYIEFKLLLTECFRAIKYKIGSKEKKGKEINFIIVV